MQTRRQIITGGLSALSVPFIGRCEPIKSMLGANNLFSDEEETNNPYISDNLLAMWDGEWNAGFYEHDEESSVWKDISGNCYDLTIPEMGAIWGENSINLSSSSLHTELPPVNRTSFTIECVCSCTGPYGAMVWMKNPAWNGGALVGWQSRGRCYYPWNVIADIGNRSLHAISLSWNPEFQFLMVDGEIAARMNGSINTRNVLAHLYIGEYAGGFCTTLSGYSFRLHERSLTEEEIRFNHLIDKERFSI